MQARYKLNADDNWEWWLRRDLAMWEEAAFGRLEATLSKLASDVVISDRINPDTSLVAHKLGIPFVRRDLLTFEVPAVRAQWLVPHDEVDTVLAEPHEGLTLSHSLSPVMPDTSFLNVTPLGVDKGEAVRVVAREYGVPLDRVMMVGDGANDVSAMQIVGVAVAMGNAERAARDAARHHVGDVDAGGLVEALTLALTL